MAMAKARARRKAAAPRRSADEDQIEKSLKRFQITADQENEGRELSFDDLQFSIGESQWDQSIRAQRDIDGRPCLTVNRLPAFIRRYTGEERQNRPAMLVDPIGSGADVETGEILQGLLRHTENVSVADVTYDTNYDFFLRTGWSYWGISTEYVSDDPADKGDAFAQEPRINLIENPFSVYMSPIRRPDGTDPLWCHQIADMSKEEYRAEFPGSKLASIDLWSAIGNRAPGWVAKNGIRIALYWWLELQPRVLCQRDDGSVCYKEDLPKGETAADEREVITRKVRCIKHNAMEVLERHEWLGRYIPYVPADALKLNINGRIYKAGMVRDAKDAQRLYNIEITGAAEMIALAPKDPLYVAEGSIDNHEEEYRQANRKNFPYLYYRAVGENGETLPPPQRAGHEPPIEAMSKMVQQADYDMKSVIGLYEPGLGEQGSPQESGVALLTRTQQSEVGGVNYSDNLNRAIRYQGRMLVDLWPKLVSSARLQRIINPDETTKHAIIFNSQYSEPSEAQALVKDPGKDKIYDLGVGKYDCVISTGPTYTTARRESAKAMLALVTADPQLFPIIGDLMVKNFDWAGSQALSERLHAYMMLTNPQLAQMEQGDQASEVMQMRQQLAALSGQHNQMVAELQRASDTIRTQRLQNETKERIALWNNRTELVLQALKSNHEAGMAQLTSTLSLLENRVQLLHESMTPEQDAGVAGPTPELPGKVEPKVEPITPAAPVTPVQPIS